MNESLKSLAVSYMLYLLVYVCARVEARINKANY